MSSAANNSRSDDSRQWHVTRRLILLNALAFVAWAIIWATVAYQIHSQSTIP